MNKIMMVGLCLTFLALSAKTIYVKSDAINNDGTNWETAFFELQSALNTAVTGDEIWVAAGTYKPSYDYGLGLGSRGNHYRLIDGVKLYGGFIGTETLVSQRNILDNETILSGDIGVEADSTDNCYHVFYHPSDIWLGGSAILDGFTVRNGNANNSTSPHDEGGGMYNYYSSPFIRNCVFDNNTAKTGGAIFNDEDSDGSILNCIFVNNTAKGNGYGGAVCNSNAAAIYTNCLFTMNTAVYGGGIMDESGSPAYINCTIVNNFASFGGGSYNYWATPVYNNSIIWGNTSTTKGHQIYNNNNCSVTLNYSCYANGIDDVTNILSSVFTATNNCLTSDPIFTNSANGDFTLLDGSLCIDSGNNTYNDQPLDLAASVRIQNVTIDRGAYEFTVLSAPLVSISQNAFNNPELSWSAIDGAHAYVIYASEDPFGIYSEVGRIQTLSYEIDAPVNYKFYYVTATNDPIKK